MKSMKPTGMKLLLTLYLTGSAALLASGQIAQIKQLTREVLLYEKAEWEIKLRAAWINPYNDSEIALNMHLTAPSGKELLIPCYYESGGSGELSAWKSRFAARETGTYSYYFELLENNQVINSFDQGEFIVFASDKKGFLNLNNLWTFKYDHGEIFRGIGENICWESRDSDDSKHFEGLHEDPRFNYGYMLKKLSDNGGNFFRTWMIYWNLPVDWKTVRNNSRYQNSTQPYNESGMKRMDQLVELCDSLGIHMMLALESHAGYMGLGWELSNYNQANGGYAETPLEFFTHSGARAQYKNKLRLMVARYGYSRSIAAWEFFNEIDNAMYQGKPGDHIPDSIITSWHDEMSTYLKEIDPFDHIVTNSVSHRDVKGMNDLKNIDINQRHIYKNTGDVPSTLIHYTQEHGKPYVIGEFGYEWDWSKNFNDFAQEMDNDFRRGLWYGLFSPTPVLPMTWWWEFFENRAMMEYFKNVRIFSDTMLHDCKGNFESFEVAGGGEQIHTYGVRCHGHSFIYVYNNSADPGNISITSDNLPESRQVIQTYNCETGRFNPESITFTGNNSILVETIRLQPKAGIILFW
jgi:hypothetical protein